MNDFGRYPLSVVLSYLTETEGTSFLITRKRYAHKLLPLFRLRTELDGLSVHKRRHCFAVYPVQDPVVLLDRVNTKRLYKRKQRPIPGLSTSDIAVQEWNDNNNRIPPELGLLRFLDRHCELAKHVGNLLVSYPRSGNTLMRTLLERVTGRVTGSDTRPDRSLSRELAELHDMVGEGVTHSSQVMFVKSHWPERTGNRIYEAKRAILLVRNPYDAIDSYWNLNATKSHTKTLTDQVYQRFQDKFERLVQNEIQVWLRFHHYWLNDCNIPVLVVRFEDLIQDPAGQLERVIMFSLGLQELSEFWKSRIEYVTSTSASPERLGSYRPRSSTKGTKSIGKSIHKGRYSNHVLDYIHQAACAHSVNFLREFGYDMKEQSFPFNFTLPDQNRPVLPAARTRCLADSVLKVNLGTPVRPADCEFGRPMQTWRHSITDKDKYPLPTVSGGE